MILRYTVLAPWHIRLNKLKLMLGAAIWFDSSSLSVFKSIRFSFIMSNAQTCKVNKLYKQFFFVWILYVNSSEGCTDMSSTATPSPARVKSPRMATRVKPWSTSARSTMKHRFDKIHPSTSECTYECMNVCRYVRMCVYKCIVSSTNIYDM